MKHLGTWGKALQNVDLLRDFHPKHAHSSYNSMYAIETVYKIDN